MPISKSDLKAKVSKDLKYVFKSLIGISDKLEGRNELLLIKSQYEDYIKQGLSGVLDSNEKNLLISKVRLRVLEWIDKYFGKDTFIIDASSQKDWTEKEMKLKNISDAILISMALAHIERDTIEIFWRIKIHFLMVKNLLDNKKYIKLKKRIELYEEFEIEFKRVHETRNMVYNSIIKNSQFASGNTNNIDLVRQSKLLFKFQRSLNEEINLDELDKKNKDLFFKFKEKKWNYFSGFIIPLFQNEEKFRLLKDMFSIIKKMNDRFREMMIRFEQIEDAI